MLFAKSLAIVALGAVSFASPVAKPAPAPAAALVDVAPAPRQNAILTGSLFQAFQTVHTAVEALIPGLDTIIAASAHHGTRVPAVPWHGKIEHGGSNGAVSGTVGFGRGIGFE
ncbi:hypothetical protein GGX14DRAFT_669300 [Mycena pura]|uniref:Uncharacterized protein n=1 Tax=Mycena pura TaxID=153505 RepID=A0AAD6YHY9_9AGAR|nr:hypothetical protein GGX14DRAFT_669300 [Mycena pura]